MPATEYLTTPTRTPRSAWAAAPANLTGLGLGYAYLRRPLRVIAAVVGTCSPTTRTTRVRPRPF